MKRYLDIAGFAKEYARKKPEDVDDDLIVVQSVSGSVDKDGIMSEENRQIPFIISDQSEDRDTDTIDPTGWHTDNYQRNPVVLWAHRYGDLPVAKSVSLSMASGKLRSTAQFADKTLHPFAETVYQMVKQGFLNASSVGFKPMKWNYNETRGGMYGSIDFLEQELLEWSVVPVPSNPNALVEARSKGIDIEPLRVWAEETLSNWGKDAGFWVPKSQIDQLLGEVRDVRAKMFVFASKDALDGDVKPYANEHACRLRNPDDFQANSFKRTTRTHDGKEYSIIMGKLRGETTMTEQAYRYAKDVWTEAQAKSHCTDHNGQSFEPAKAIRSGKLHGDVDHKAKIGEMLKGKSVAKHGISLDGSYEEIAEDIEDVLEETLNCEEVEVFATFRDHVFAAAYGEDDDDVSYWDVTYRVSADGTISLGNPTPLQQLFAPGTLEDTKSEGDDNMTVKLDPDQLTQIVNQVRSQLAVNITLDGTPLKGNADQWIESVKGELQKSGRVLSSANEEKLRSAHSSIGDVLAQLGDEEGKSSDNDEDVEITAEELQALISEYRMAHTGRID